MLSLFDFGNRFLLLPLDVVGGFPQDVGFVILEVFEVGDVVLLGLAF
jgi:hypothetical protein